MTRVTKPNKRDVKKSTMVEMPEPTIGMSMTDPLATETIPKKKRKTSKK